MVLWREIFFSLNWKGTSSFNKLDIHNTFRPIHRELKQSGKNTLFPLPIKFPSWSANLVALLIDWQYYMIVPRLVITP